MNRSSKRSCRAAAPIVFSIIVCCCAVSVDAATPGSSAARAEAWLRWADAEQADAMRKLPAGTTLPPPSEASVARSLNLFATSPLTGSGMQQPVGRAGGSPTSSGQASGQAPPPIQIQLPPHPPESQAPPAQWRPPVQVPDPSTIPSPPLSQAPPQQQRPPVQPPNPATGATGRPPIEPLTIPLPPHPPDSQAPWNQRG